MSKKANPAAIGLFIVFGLALGIGGLLLFTSNKLFGRQLRFILYFNTSLKGLNQGAPVKFRGVTVGSVSEVLIRHNQADTDLHMPVIIDIDEKMAQAKSDRQLRIERPHGLEELIRKGLRGKLDTESIVTGVLYVELEVMPDAMPPTFHQLSPEYAEIPTVPTRIEQLLDNLSKLDIHGVTARLDKLLLRLDTSLSQFNTVELNSSLSNLLGTANRILAAPELTNSLQGISRTIDNAATLLKKVEGRVDPLAEGATTTLAAAQKTLAALDNSIRSLNALLDSDAPLRTDLTLTLEQFSNAARSVAALAEFLERNPNALLTGRKPRKDNP